MSTSCRVEWRVRL